MQETWDVCVLWVVWVIPKQSPSGVCEDYTAIANSLSFDSVFCRELDFFGGFFDTFGLMLLEEHTYEFALTFEHLQPIYVMYCILHLEGASSICWKFCDFSIHLKWTFVTFLSQIEMWFIWLYVSASYGRKTKLS